MDPHGNAVGKIVQALGCEWLKKPLTCRDHSFTYRQKNLRMGAILPIC
jgi:hypothetical protein